MDFKPILFNTEMVRAILDGRKTQTRRLLKPKYRPGEDSFQIITNAHSGRFVRVEYCDEYGNETRWMPPPCEVGDILWVRETWCDPEPDNYMVPVFYKADMPLHWDAEDTAHGEAVDITADEFKWCPSIHMPKGFARIFLKVKDVRVERLQDITEEQAEKEGCWAGCFRSTCGPVDNYDEPPEQFDAVEDFQRVWDSTIKPAERDKYSWDANPWVWVIEFKRIKQPKEF